MFVFDIYFYLYVCFLFAKLYLATFKKKHNVICEGEGGGWEVSREKIVLNMV